MRDLGEDVFPEPTPVPALETAAVDAAKSDESAEGSSAVEKQDAPPDTPGAPETSTPHTSAAEKEEKERIVTTVQREPVKVPETVHVRITPESLKEYVGPAVYQKDRLYVQAPPAGVSTGLGYLGNGSGAVMPIEAIVSLPAVKA